MGSASPSSIGGYAIQLAAEVSVSVVCSQLHIQALVCVGRGVRMCTANMYVYMLDIDVCKGCLALLSRQRMSSMFNQWHTACAPWSIATDCRLQTRWASGVLHAQVRAGPVPAPGPASSSTPASPGGWHDARAVVEIINSHNRKGRPLCTNVPDVIMPELVTYHISVWVSPNGYGSLGMPSICIAGISCGMLPF